MNHPERIQADPHTNGGLESKESPFGIHYADVHSIVGWSKAIFCILAGRTSELYQLFWGLPGYQWVPVVWPSFGARGSPLPRANFANDVGYLPDGTPMNRAGNALNHPDTWQRFESPAFARRCLMEQEIGHIDSTLLLLEYVLIQFILCSFHSATEHAVGIVACPFFGALWSCEWFAGLVAHHPKNPINPTNPTNPSIRFIDAPFLPFFYNRWQLVNGGQRYAAPAKTSLSPLQDMIGSFSASLNMWRFPKMGVPLNHQFW